MRTKSVVSVMIAVGYLSSPLCAQTTAAASSSRIEAGFAVDRLARIDQMPLDQ